MKRHLGLMTSTSIPTNDILDLSTSKQTNKTLSTKTHLLTPSSSFIPGTHQAQTPTYSQLQSTTSETNFTSSPMSTKEMKPTINKTEENQTITMPPWNVTVPSTNTTIAVSTTSDESFLTLGPRGE